MSIRTTGDKTEQVSIGENFRAREAFDLKSRENKGPVPQPPYVQQQARQRVGC